MQARWGIAWLVAAFWLVSLFCATSAGMAASFTWNANTGAPLPIFLAGSQSSLETQLLGDKPSSSRPGASFFPEPTPSLQLHQDGSTLRLPYNVEMNISFLYKRDPATLETQRLGDSAFFMKYGMDYRLLPNLQVGLSGYLYRPSDETFNFQRPPNSPLRGFGPELKYDLGRWSFLLKSQVETGNRLRGDDLQNWFRVWYAF